MSDTAIWDRFGALARATVPEWARYEGYGTWALGGFAYAVAMAGIAALAYTRDYGTIAVIAGVLALFALSLGRYYQGAAKVRVTCNHCDAHARGKNLCPECGERTYTGGNR